MNFKWFVSILAAVMVWGNIAMAEDIQNDSGCDVCDGAIHYGPEETRKIFGDDIRKKINNIWWQGIKSVWVDLDGVFKNTEMPKDENQFEIKIYGTIHKVFIKSLMDDSVMELVLNDFNEPSENAVTEVLPEWLPEIYLYAGHTGPIDLTDSLDAAWGKLEERHIYQYAGGGVDIREKPEELRKQIMKALNMLAPN